MAPRNAIPTAIKALTLCSILCASTAFGDDGHRHPNLVEGLSGHHHPITTSSADAQRLFDQGLELAWGFNHDAAIASFRAAQELDPRCGMCFWGEALALGPNINAVMEAEAVPLVWLALEKARSNSEHLTAHERAYIAALGERYTAAGTDDRSALDQAYAKAMRRVTTRYPDDLDAAVLFAEALMDTTPWDYWTDDNEPRPVTTEFLGALESVLRREPAHPGANHLLIHTVEKVRPELGVAAAERLESLAEGAGHLVHMGAHIFIRVGRYADAVRVNQKAITADQRFAESHDVSTTYGFLYGLHNHHFLAAAAGFLGRRDLAEKAALELRSQVDTSLMRQPGMSTGQHYWVTPYFTWVRFGSWGKILQEPKPDADLLYPTAVWHYARGMAFARTQRPEAAAAELEALARFASDRRLDSVTIWDLNTSRQLLEIGQHVLAGELDAINGEYRRATEHLERAVVLEEQLTYDEPPPWSTPVRHNLGAILLEAGRTKEAEAVYREDLELYPWNGWSLRGLQLSLERQGDSAQAAEIARRFRDAWNDADVELTSSRF